MPVSTSAGMVLQPGMARHGVLSQCCQQRHPEGKSAGRTGPPQVRHLCVQSPPQPQQGAALLCCHVSYQTQNNGVYGAKCNFPCALHWKKPGRNVACEMLNIVLIGNIIKPAYTISACRPVERHDFLYFLTMHDQMQRRQLRVIRERDGVMQWRKKEPRQWVQIENTWMRDNRIESIWQMQ